MICERRRPVRGFSSEAAVFSMLPELEGTRNGLRRRKARLQKNFPKRGVHGETLL